MRQRRNGASEGGRGGTALTLSLPSQGSWPRSPGSARGRKQRGRGREGAAALSPPRKAVAQEGEKEISLGGPPRNGDLGAQKERGFKGTLGVTKRSQAVGDYLPFP